MIKTSIFFIFNIIKEAYYIVYVEIKMCTSISFPNTTFIYDPVETNAGIGYDVKSRTFTDPERELNLLNTSTTAYDRSHSSIPGKIS